MSNLRSRFVRPVDWGHERRCRSKMVNKCAGTIACFFLLWLCLYARALLQAPSQSLCCLCVAFSFPLSPLSSLFPFFSLFLFFACLSEGGFGFLSPFHFFPFPLCFVTLFFFLFPVPSIPRSRLEKGRSVATATATATAAAMGAPDSNSDLHKPIIPKTPKPSGNWRASQIKELFQ